METKRSIYIFSFTVLGLLLGFVIHALVEVVYIRLLIKDFAVYSFGLTWTELMNFHYLFSGVVFVICGLWGYAAGKYWWKQIYVLRKYGTKKFAGWR